MKIHEMRIAPNPRRVRIFLAEKGITDIEYVQVDLSKGEHLTPEFRKMNPFCTVPVLELDDGTFISETIAICRYFEALHPEPNLFGRGAREQALVEMWQRRIEFYFMLPTGMAFQHLNDYFKAYKPQVREWGELCLSRAEKMFGMMDAHLATTPFVAGDRFTVADITLLCTVDFNKVNNLRLTDAHPNLRRWYDDVSARPSAQA